LRWAGRSVYNALQLVMRDAFTNPTPFTKGVRLGRWQSFGESPHVGSPFVADG